MPDRMILRDRTAVVTGAASGIGRAVAISLARRGCHLALADINEAQLSETAKLAASHGQSLRITCYALDVTDRKAVASFPLHYWRRMAASIFSSTMPASRSAARSTR